MADRKTKKETNRMVRTSVALDEALVREAMELTGIRTKRALIDEALRKLIRLRKQERILDLCGTIEWEDDPDQVRASRFPDRD